MLVIYVGYSGDIIKRILKQHCSGNVNGSVLREQIAEKLGYELEITHPNGIRRIRIDLPNPRDGENEVSNYIKSGEWRYVICESAEEARDFNNYVINQLNPLVNVQHPQWNIGNENRYRGLFRRLNKSKRFTCKSIRGKQTGPGVCVFYHESEPSRSVRS